MAASSAAAHGAHLDDHHEHPPTVIPSAKMPTGLMGMFFFIGSEIALFGSFFMAYFFIRKVGEADYKSWAEAMGHVIPLKVAFFNSLVLFSSSATIHWAGTAMKKGNRRRMSGWLAATIVLGLTFLSIQVVEYRGLVVHEEIGPSSNAYSSVFFSLTGLHGSHVLVGAILLSVMLVRSLRGHYSKESHVGWEAMSLYWHFVDLVWVFVFGLIYLPGNLDRLFSELGF